MRVVSKNHSRQAQNVAKSKKKSTSTKGKKRPFGEAGG